MSRLLRWTFNTLAAASLLLCLATAGLWVRSYWMPEIFVAERSEPGDWGIYYDIRHYREFLAFYPGRCVVYFEWSERPDARPTPPWEFSVQHWRYEVSDTSLTVDANRRVIGGYAYNVRYCTLPTWSLVSAFAVLPAVVVVRQAGAIRRRWRRVRIGCCPACGYDLRATPERCPECGAAAVATRGPVAADSTELVEARRPAR